LSPLLRIEGAAPFEVHAASIRSGVACTVGVDFFYAAVRWGGGTSSKEDVKFDEPVPQGRDRGANVEGGCVDALFSDSVMVVAASRR
jgi:hypothetical protein